MDGWLDGGEERVHARIEIWRKETQGGVKKNTNTSSRIKFVHSLEYLRITLSLCSKTFKTLIF